MSSAAVTMPSAPTSSPAVAAAPPNEAQQVTPDPRDTDQAQSFTEVLSEHGVGSRHHPAGPDNEAGQKESSATPGPTDGETPLQASAESVDAAPAAAPPPGLVAALAPVPQQAAPTSALAGAVGHASPGGDGVETLTGDPIVAPSASSPSSSTTPSAGLDPALDAGPTVPAASADGRSESSAPADPIPGFDLPPTVGAAAAPAAPATAAPDSPVAPIGQRPLRSAEDIAGSPPADRRADATGPASVTSAHDVGATVDPPVTAAPIGPEHGQVTPGSLDLATASHAAGAISRATEITSPATSLSEAASNPLDVEGLSGSISRPLSDGNGTYTVTVAMHPPELGHLQAVMSLDGNDLLVSITAQTQKGHEALSVAADALKNQLARGGVNVNVTLRDPGSPSQGDDRRRGAAPADGHSGPEDADTTVTPSLVLPSGQIHLVL